MQMTWCQVRASRQPPADLDRGPAARPGVDLVEHQSPGGVGRRARPRSQHDPGQLTAGRALVHRAGRGAGMRDQPQLDVVDATRAEGDLPAEHHGRPGRPAAETTATARARGIARPASSAAAARRTRGPPATGPRRPGRRGRPLRRPTTRSRLGDQSPRPSRRPRLELQQPLHRLASVTSERTVDVGAVRAGQRGEVGAALLHGGRRIGSRRCPRRRRRGRRRRRRAGTPASRIRGPEVGELRVEVPLGRADAAAPAETMSTAPGSRHRPAGSATRAACGRLGGPDRRLGVLRGGAARCRVRRPRRRSARSARCPPAEHAATPPRHRPARPLGDVGQLGPHRGEPGVPLAVVGQRLGDGLAGEPVEGGPLGRGLAAGAAAPRTGRARPRGPRRAGRQRSRAPPGRRPRPGPAVRDHRRTGRSAKPAALVELAAGLPDPAPRSAQSGATGRLPSTKARS